MPSFKLFSGKCKLKNNLSAEEINSLKALMRNESCNISLDRSFTFVWVAIWAKEKGLTLVGTTRLDRKGIPKEIKSLEHREEKLTMYTYAEGPSIKYVRKIFRKTNISNPLTCTLKYLMYKISCFLTLKRKVWLEKCCIDNNTW